MSNQATLDQHSAFSFANLAGYSSMHNFQADVASGVIPPPDGYANGHPWWRRATIEKFRGGNAR